MKKQFKLKPLVAVLGGAALAISATSAIAQIANTRHNLSASNLSSTGSAMNWNNSTAEICVFCHTPHASSSDLTATGDPYAPLWNKGLSNLGTNNYTLYSSNTLDAQFAVDGKNNSGVKAIGSVSLACLSCHDGTQAMDNIINAPGFGGYSAAGRAFGATNSWSGPRVNTGTGMLTNGTGGNSAIAMIGTYLGDDHPIGIAYCASTSNFANQTITCGDKDFLIPTSQTYNTTRRWWIDTDYSQVITVRTTGGSQAATVGGNANQRERTDIMLYNRKISGQSAEYVATVECASCHDPHVAPKATNQTAFLRITQAGSGVCLACHAK